MVVEMVNFEELIRAEAVLSTPTPALSDAPAITGVRHLMNLTIPRSHVNKRIDGFRLAAV